MDPSFIKYLPNSFIKFFAKPYIGGDSEEKVINCAKEIYKENKFLATLDALGEDVKSVNDINRYVNIYLELIKKISRLDFFPGSFEQPSVSLKPSCFSIVAKNVDGSVNQEKMDWEGCYQNIFKICNYAKEHNVRVSVDMEDRHWTDFTLKTYFQLLDSGFDNVGAVIQTRLFRTREDLNLFNEKSRVRLVIGIYNEPSEVALTDKQAMKDLMVEFSKVLFDKGVYVEFATHDEDCVKKFFNEVIIPNRISKDRYEVQMLLGVPREKMQRELISGEYLKRLAEAKSVSFEEPKVNFRLYLPFAQTWDNAVAYCRRRLIENPNIITYGLKNLVIK
jgi:proline dehydrogenase